MSINGLGWNIQSIFLRLVGLTTVIRNNFSTQPQPNVDSVELSDCIFFFHFPNACKV